MVEVVGQGHVGKIDRAAACVVELNPVGKRAVFVGNLRREKGVDDLIEAVAKLPPTVRSKKCAMFPTRS